MIDSIKNFFNREILTPTTAGSENAAEHALQLATAALLIEMTRADFGVSEEELQSVARAVRHAFGLREAECDALIRLAEEEAGRAACLHEFTSLIDRDMSQDQKVHIIELLWRVAYSDQVLDKYEEHLMRKIAGLLHVSHRDLIRAKLRVTGQEE